MNKKVVVLIMLGVMQSANATLFEMILNWPGIKQVCAIALVISQKNSKRQSIMPATQEVDANGLVEKKLPLERIDGTRGHGLKITSYLPANFNIEARENNQEIIIEPSFTAPETEATSLVCRCDRINGGNDSGLFEISIFNKNANTPKTKSSLWSKIPLLAFLRKKEPVSAPKISFDVKIIIPSSYSTFKCLELPEGNIVLKSKIKLKTSCNCSIKKGAIAIDNIEGAITAHTGLGNVNVSNWTLPESNEPIVNSLSTDLGNIHSTLPKNTVAIFPKQRKITLNNKNQFMQSFIHAKQFHKVTISTDGKVELTTEKLD